MKKKKSDNKPPADFKNNPFKPLKGFAPLTPSAKKAGAVHQKKERQSEDDSTLFLRAVAGTRRLGGDDEPASVPADPKIPVARDLAASEDRDLFLRAMQKIGPTLREPQPEEEELDGPQRRLPTSRMRQLKRGSIRIADELDLHGFLKDEALSRLERFIIGAHQRGAEAVLVITGKGVNSPEGPVLKGAVAAWFGSRGKGMVAEFSPAPRDRGGSGAFVAFLKKR